MKRMIEKYILVFIGLTLTTSIYCQIETEQIEVVKAFEITLEDARKETIKPKLEVVTTEKKTYDYDVTIIPLALKYPEPIIKPLSTPVDEPFASKDFYFKGGYGNLKNPYAKLRYSRYDSDLYDVNVYGNLIAVDNSKKIDFHKMLKASAGVASKFRVNENMYVKANTDLDYDKRLFYFTPFDHALSLEKDLVRNTGVLGFGAGIENIEETDLGIDYEVNFKGNLVNTTNSNANQQSLSLDAQISKRKSDIARIVLPISGGIYRYSVPSIEDKTYTFKTLSFKPQLHYNNKKLVIDAGLALLVDDESTRPWPFIDVAYGLMDNYVQVFAGTDQKAETNDLKYSLRTSPWMDSSIDSIRNMVNREYYGGVRGEFAHLSYQARGGYRQGFNQPLYINFKGPNNTNLVLDKPNQFYAELNTIFINGNVDFWYNEYLTVGGVLTKNFYQLDKVKEAWGMPSLELNLYARLNLMNEKVKLKGDVYIADKSSTLYLNPAASVLPEIVEGNNMVDLNLEAEFWPTSKFGVYFQANNLLNNKYARWFGYEQVGLNINGGIVLNF